MSEKSQVKCEHCGKWIYWLEAYYFGNDAYCTREAQLAAMNKHFDDKRKQVKENAKNTQRT